MIISCPHCQTKYQVTYEAIGSAGRKVQCAHCQQAWDQPPIDKDEPPPEIRKAEQAIAEDQLDDAMGAEDRAAARPAKVPAEKPAKAPRPVKVKPVKAKKAVKVVNQASAGMIDPAVIRKRRRAFSRPDRQWLDEVPLARLRLGLRIIGGTALVALLALSYLGRVQVVERFPAMAGVYAAVGLGINVVGLDFSDVSAMQTLRNGKEVLIVSAQIVGQSPSPVPVPAVVVTLIGANGEGVYQWSVQPSVPDLMAGERSTFDTQLTLPPGEASRVRLSFAGGADFRAGATQPAALAAAPGEADGHAMPASPADAEPHAAEPHAPEPHAAEPHAAEPAPAASHGEAAAPDHATPEHP